jgi:hypothetical protein
MTASIQTNEKGSRKGRRAAAIKELSEGKSRFLGELVILSTGTGKKHKLKEIISALESCDLNKEVAKELSPRAAFTRAARELADERVIDILRDETDHITFQFTAKAMKDSEWKYSKETNVVLDKISGKVRCPSSNIEELAQKALDRALEERGTSDITEMVKRLFSENGDIISARDEGGVYFVPEPYRAFSDKVQDFLKLLGRRINRWPIPAGEDRADESVQDVCTSYIQRLCEQLDVAISGFGTSTRATTIEATAAHINELMVKVEAFASYFGDMKESSLALVASKQRMLAEQVDKIADLKASAPPGTNGSGKKVGIIAAIIEVLESASAKKPVTRDEIHAKLVEKFPERDPKGMRNTVMSQVPGCLLKEKGITVNRNDRGYWL